MLSNNFSDDKWRVTSDDVSKGGEDLELETFYIDLNQPDMIYVIKGISIHHIHNKRLSGAFVEAGPQASFAMIAVGNEKIKLPWFVADGGIVKNHLLQSVPVHCSLENSRDHGIWFESYNATVSSYRPCSSQAGHSYIRAHIDKGIALFK